MALPDDSTVRYETTYEYGTNSGSGAFTLGGFNPTRVINARGFATDTKYDDAYRAVQTVRRHDDGNGRYSYANPAANEPATQTTYNDVHNVTSTTVLNDGGNRVSYTFYDHLHRPTVSVVDMGGDGPGQGVELEDVFDDASTFSGDADDLITRSAYDLSGLVISATDAEGRTSETVYDGAGRAVESRAPAVDVYDPDAGTITGFEPTSTTVYDAAGNVAVVTDPAGRQSKSFYDARNRPIKTILDFDGDTYFEDTQGTNYQDIVTVTGYDLNGNVLYGVDPRGNRTDTAYDMADRPVLVEGPEVADAENNGTMIRPTKVIAQSVVHLETLLVEAEEQRRKVQQISQVLLRKALANNRDLVSPYALCPCDSGNKVRFCCGQHRN